jgi:hypothetical protein
VRDSAFGDDGLDAPRPEQPAVLGEVIAAVGQQSIGRFARPADLAGHRPGGQVIQERDELGDVVALAARQRDGQRDAGRVDQQMVL